MKRKAAAKSTTQSPSSGSGLTHPTNGVASSLAVTFLDTTWRIATPVLLFTIGGIAADLHWGTKPWLTFICVPIGFVLAALLVKKQLEAVQKAEDK